MAELVNLRRFKKGKARAAADEAAAQARIEHGRTKTEKAQTRAEREKSARDLDGHKRGD